MTAAIQARWLGRISYGDALAMQEEIVALKRADSSLADELLLLEHEPVYTIGRTPDQSSLRGGVHLPHPLFPINRGGRRPIMGPASSSGTRSSTCAGTNRICIVTSVGSRTCCSSCLPATTSRHKHARA